MTRTQKRFFLLAISTVLFFIAAMWFRFSGGDSHDTAHVQDEKDMVEDQQQRPARDIFGLPAEGYRRGEAMVGRGQTLSHIFGSLGFSARQIYDISNRMEPVFRPSRIRQGNAYHTYMQGDSAQVLDYLVYEINDVDYLLFDFTDSLHIERKSRLVTTQRAKAGGVIRTSLWNTIVNNDIHPELVLHMSRVLAWSVDFYRIREGDRFLVLFTEEYIGDQRYGIAHVDAVRFIHRGRKIEAFRFASDTLTGYYDHDGNNVRKAFLRAPLEFGRITSRYSHSRLHPIHGDRRPHLGTDYAASHGTPILAVGDGVVTRVSYTSGNGNYVRIRHTSVYETQYLHMSSFASGIEPGARVGQGDVIGYVGSTGLATGPHVCFRFWKNGRQVDHLRLEFPSGDPLPEGYMDEFRRKANRLRSKLESIRADDDKLAGR